ncbi:MAG TPA: hypothetical protein VGB12_13315 [bacterium]
MQAAGRLLPEDDILFQRWLQALEGHLPTLPKGRDGPDHRLIL